MVDETDFLREGEMVDESFDDITMATSETIPESGPVHPSGGTVYATPYVAPAHGSVGLGERPEKFNGKDFKRWQQKMLFYLTTLNLARFLQEDAPDLRENPDRQTVAAVDAWKHSDFLCKNYILNGLDNALYNLYSPMVNAKALWESLERKYKTKDAGSKKFVVGKFLDFKMVDSKTVISQVQEFQLILHDIHAEGMVLGESFQVAALIEKLLPTWKDFKNYLKHKHKEMKLEDLIVRLRIEEDNRQSEKKAGNYHQEAKANVVEQATFRSGFGDSLFRGEALLNGLRRLVVPEQHVRKNPAGYEMDNKTYAEEIDIEAVEMRQTSVVLEEKG
ncbi:hypothetical protein RJ639_009861 [Escallonia herrerae]|uniref:Gag protein n=1 Tax=Escallonia herrerae TaxID=1293975 RepID=A0AA89ARU4_9ASTE|nr:hypothetical protein RJ639_009861 [Escallonia herrerae]